MNKKTNKSSNLVIYTLIIIVLFAVLFAINQSTQKKSTENQVTSNAPSITGQPVMGDVNAKVSIVEFGDYKCPTCKAWGERIWPQLKKDYIDSGKATFSYVNVLFHGGESILAAAASESIYQNHPEEFWAFHKALYDAQPNVNHDDAWVTEEKVLEIAKATVPSLNIEQFQQSLKSSETQAMVEKDQQMVTDFNIQSTPTIMINNVVITNPLDYESIKSAIEKELK